MIYFDSKALSPNPLNPNPSAAVDVTKPYEFIGFGAMEVTKPYEFIGFGATEVTKPYEFIGFGAPGPGPGTSSGPGGRHRALPGGPGAS